MSTENPILKQATESLIRIQEFDVSSLPRKDELGTALNFSDALEPANRLVDLYKQLPVEVLDQIPNTFLQTINQRAEADYNTLNAILKFEAGSPKQERDSCLQRLISSYDPAFSELYHFISYSVRKSTDFGRLEREAATTLQTATETANSLQKELEIRKKEADAILAEVRKVAAEQGVSQQAIYFKNEADSHDEASRKWLNTTIGLTVLLTLYAVSTLFLHKLTWLAPSNAYETTQLAVSKVLVFATISFFLILSSRNYLAHRHNYVVNKHRQNSLATYEAIVKAAGEESNRDVILAKAADCIFSAQATAFGKSESPENGSLSSLVNIAPSALKTPSS